VKVFFNNIPGSAKFAVFDYANKSKDRTISFYVEEGNSVFEAEIPAEWESPYRTLIPNPEYYVHDHYLSIEDVNEELEINGGEFYLDVTRQPADEEHNKRSIEDLITAVGNNETLTGRQKFYISLVSLQSWFEYLVHGMLILSRHISKTKFEDLDNHKKRTKVAFDKANTDFFSTTITIAPGKGSFGADISDEHRAEMENIFNEVRTLRNKIVHKWGIKDVGRDQLIKIFERIGENPMYAPDDDDWYAEAAFLFVRLYARTNPLKSQLSYFIEKEAVESERKQRGYEP